MDKIKKIIWIKDWESRTCILLGSHTMSCYIQHISDSLGGGIKDVFIIHKKGVSTCFFGKSVIKKFCKFLAKKVEKNNNLLIEWSKQLKQTTDSLREIIKKPIKTFLDVNEYKNFEKAYEKCHKYVTFVKDIPNYLSYETINKHYLVIEDARKYTEGIFDELETFFIKLGELISKKGGYETKHIQALFRNEIINYLENKILPDKEILEKRYECTGFLMYNGQEHILGNEAIDLENAINKTEKAIKELKGKTAFPGKVKGVCRIINNPFEVKKFDKGDIIVAVMTRPDFVTLLDKAAAIITDAGGILSHAAIVARELKKPCIVGTELATAVFDDGEIIELDADNGIVRKIKKVGIKH